MKMSDFQRAYVSVVFKHSDRNEHRKRWTRFAYRFALSFAHPKKIK